MNRRKNNHKSPIPKKLHFIWLGNKKPPYLKKFMKTFTTYAPGFSIHLWGDQDISKKNFPKTYSTIQKVKKIHGSNLKNYNRSKTMYKTNKDPYTYSKFAQISDLMRYEILYNEGGYYFDCNMYLLKDITSLFSRHEPLILCNELGTNLQKSDIISNSFIGAIPKSPVIGRLISRSFLKNINLHNPQVDEETGPWALRSVLNIKKDKFHVLPEDTFYPYILPWTSNEDHPLRKSSKPKCSGRKKTKKRTLKMKPNLWVEFPCKRYKQSYGLKIWESGGSWTTPHKWYVKDDIDSEKFRSVYSGGGIEGGFAPAAACVPCVTAAAASPVGLVAGAAGACMYGIHKAYKCVKTKKKKQTKKNKKKSTKKKKST